MHKLYLVIKMNIEEKTKMSLNPIAEFNPKSNIHVFHPFLALLAKPTTPHKLHLVMKMNI